jgi:hypothetical protein
LTHGWYWDQEVAKRIGGDPGVKKGHVTEHDVIVVDGDILLAITEDFETSIQKITVRNGTDEDIRNAALARLPEIHKKSLGLPFDETLLQEQALPESTKSWEKDRVLLLELTSEETRCLGLSPDKKQAQKKFDKAWDEHEAKEATS